MQNRIRKTKSVEKSQLSRSGSKSRPAADVVYTKVLEWSDEDGCFVGSAPPLIGPCCHGPDEAKVYAELCQIVDEWVEILKSDGIPLPPAPGRKDFSGKFVLRVEPALHRRLALRALAAGESLNNYCVKMLSKGEHV